MRRSKPVSLGHMIDNWLKTHQKHERVFKAGVVNRWADFVGPAAARYTESIRFEGDILFVRLKSAVVRRELEMIKAPLIERINREAGSDHVISDIRFSS